MPSASVKRSFDWLNAIGRSLLKRLETPSESYERMIAKAFQKVGYPIVPVLKPETHSNEKAINNPYGSELIMRHYSQIVPRDFDLSPNFEVVKYNIIGMGRFDYQSIWADKRDLPIVQHNSRRL